MIIHEEKIDKFYNIQTKVLLWYDNRSKTCSVFQIKKYNTISVIEKLVDNLKLEQMAKTTSKI